MGETANAIGIGKHNTSGMMMASAAEVSAAIVMVKLTACCSKELMDSSFITYYQPIALLHFEIERAPHCGIEFNGAIINELFPCVTESGVHLMRMEYAGE